MGKEWGWGYGGVGVGVDIHLGVCVGVRNGGGGWEVKSGVGIMVRLALGAPHANHTLTTP